MPRRLILIDGHSNVFKAFHAIKVPLTTSRGETTHAVLGFINMFLRLRRQTAMEHVAVVFDAHAPSFRHLQYDAYKATRRETPPDLHRQVDRIRQVLLAMKVPIVESPGFEADDTLASFAVRAVERGGEALVCSVDKDVLQVVRPGIRIWREHHGKAEELDEEGVRGRTGVLPRQVPDWLALIGDTSDNLPGVPGIGEKTATKLLQEYADLEAILAAAPDMKPGKVRDSLIGFGAQAIRTRELVRLRYDVPEDFTWESTHWTLEPTEELRALLLELEFGRLLSDFGLSQVRIVPQQTSLFGDAEGTQEAASSPAAKPSAPATVAPVRSVDYRAVTTPEALAESMAAIRAAGIAAIDTETTGLDPFEASLVGISLSWAPNQGVYIPVGHSTGEAQLPLAAVREALAPVLADPAVQWVAHHWKFDQKMLLRAGFPWREVASDTQIASYLLNPDGANHGLKGLATERLGIQMTAITELIGLGRQRISIAQVPVAKVAAYASADADITLALHRHFAPMIEEAGLSAIYREVELPLVNVLARMELEGIAIDAPYFEALSAEVASDLARIEREAYEIAGQPFNLNSPKQVGELLFGKLGLRKGKKTQTGWSTDVSVLESLKDDHALPAKLLEYRHLEKLRSTYIDALPRQVKAETGRLHTSFNQTEAATGRLSSSEPNLQNIPVRSEEGRRIRRGFVRRADGWRLLSADYSQIELRLLAHISGDAALREAFAADQDIHALTASKVFKVPIAEVTKAQRGQAKAINFGIVYGMTASRLGRDLGLTTKEARKFIDDYFEVYQGVRDYMKRMPEVARTEGAVRTPLGRRRPMPEINSPDFSRRAFAERIAVNTPIQGACADMIKLAMIRIDRRLREEGRAARMILQVHDELILDVPEAELAAVEALVREEMAAAMPLSVPVKVDTAVGDNWAEV
jgi:DNA polymerase-1